MIDIHPPQHGTITRRDFFVHLFIVVLGILIAIGLEQSVEFFHHRQQLHELREGLLADARLYLRDVDQNRAAQSRAIEDLTARVQQVRGAISEHQLLASPVYRRALPVNTIRLGNFAAAKSSGLVNLLTIDEINSFSDAEVGVVKSEALKAQAHEAATKRVAFEQRFQSAYPSGPSDFSRITPAQIDEYLGLLIEERQRRSYTLAYLDSMHRACQAFLNGQRNIDKLRESAELPAD